MVANDSFFSVQSVVMFVQNVTLSIFYISANGLEQTWKSLHSKGPIHPEGPHTP